MRVAALIVAAGSGTRMGGIAKQYRQLGGKPVLRRTLEAFCGHPAVSVVQVVISEDHGADYLATTSGMALLPPVMGGATRQDSVGRGLLALEGVDAVLIHDAARPFVSAAVIDRVIAALSAYQGAAPALPVVDSLRDDALEIIPRDGLFRMQTPQGFHLAPLRSAHEHATAGHTDDVSVARAAGMAVVLVEGDEANFKITTEADWMMAQQLMRASMLPRVGSGFDVHRFGPNADGSRDHVWLGGIKVPHDDGVLGHSDADVALHALTDAILGALADGDIGSHFPPSDARWRGAASWQFLDHARALVDARCGEISHADVTIICERPKVGPHREAMRARISEILRIDVSRVSVKATTTEALGFTGRREGLAAQASATLLLPEA